MDVSSIMSPEPIWVTLDTPVESAKEIMENEDIRHLPIMANDRVVGVVCDRDLYPTETEANFDRRTSATAAPRIIADILQSRLTTVSPDDSLATAAVQCLLQKDGCLPVMRESRLVGILSEMDLLRTCARTWFDGPSGDGVQRPSVDDLMTPFPLAATPRTTVTEAIGMCRTLRAHHLPVVEGETLAGIVSDRDLRRCSAAGRAPETTLGEIMVREPLTIGPLQPLAEAAALMSTGKISALPVVDGNQLVGIITLTDLIQHFIHAQTTERSSRGD